MKSWKRIGIASTLFLLIFMSGCSQPFGKKEDKYNETVEKHKAIEMYRAGVWEERYEYVTQQYTSKIESTTLKVSIDVQEKLSKEEIKEIMDYYEFTKNASFDNSGAYIGPMEIDYTCYAAFYKKDTDELLECYKYKNGEFVTATKEEEGNFPKANEHSKSLSGGEEEILP